MYIQIIMEEKQDCKKYCKNIQQKKKKIKRLAGNYFAFNCL